MKLGMYALLPIVLAAGLTAETQAPPAPTTVIRAGTLIDGTSATTRITVY